MHNAPTTILVPVDFSQASHLALHCAVDLAKRLDGSIHVLHVVEDPPATGLIAEAYVGLATLRQNRRVEARRRMTELLATLHGARFSDEVVMGSVARTIADTANDRHADFIVMGTHGRTGLAHALLGSVAEDVIRIAPCPVMTVRQDLPARRAAAETRQAASA